MAWPVIYIKKWNIYLHFEAMQTFVALSQTRTVWQVSCSNLSFVYNDEVLRDEEVLGMAKAGKKTVVRPVRKVKNVRVYSERSHTKHASIPNQMVAYSQKKKSAFGIKKKFRLLFAHLPAGGADVLCRLFILLYRPKATQFSFVV